MSRATPPTDTRLLVRRKGVSGVTEAHSSVSVVQAAAVVTGQVFHLRTWVRHCRTETLRQSMVSYWLLLLLFCFFVVVAAVVEITLLISPGTYFLSVCSKYFFVCLNLFLYHCLSESLALSVCLSVCLSVSVCVCLSSSLALLLCFLLTPNYLFSFLLFEAKLLGFNFLSACTCNVPQYD